MPHQYSNIRFITCASNPRVLDNCLLSSPDLTKARYPLAIHLAASSAAAAFNAEMEQPYAANWLVWAHQDVYLPAGWGEMFENALRQAEVIFPRMAIAGVYGIVGNGAAMQRAGHIIDRGNPLSEPLFLPCKVDSLDELLFAVRTNTSLRLDPRLKFDFYATDLVLQARQQGLDAVVVDACCEHRSATPRERIDHRLKERLDASGNYFEHKWFQAMPITTPCLSIQKPGDVARWTKQLCGDCAG